MEENEFEMDLFGDSNYDLNYEDNPFESFTEEQTEDTDNDKSQDDNTDDQSDNNDNNLDEDESSEEVGEDEVGDEGEGESNNSPNLYSSLFSVLHEEGLLPSLDPTSVEVKTPADLAEAFKKEIDVQADLRLYKYLENIDVNQIAQSKAQLNDLSEINEDYLKDNLDIAKEIIKQDYLNQGLPEAKVNRLLNKTIDLGEEMVLEEALESLESLKVFNQRKIEQEQIAYKERLVQEQKDNEALQNKIKDSLYNSKSFIEGLPVNKAIQDRVYKAMNDVVSKDPTTGEMENELMKSRRENPLEFDLKLYYLYTLTNGFKNFNNIVSNTKSKVIKDLETAIRRTPVKDNGIPSFLQDSNSYSGMGDELVL